MRKCKIAAMLAITLISATACKEKKMQKIGPVKVKTEKVRTVAVNGGTEYSGTVEESSGSVLSFSVGGTLRQITVEAGQYVNKGSLIAVLDDETLQSSHAATVAALNQVEDAYRRMKQLYDNGSLPEMQWVEIQSKLKQAQSSERIARKSLHDGKLYAPFSGVVSEKHVEIGYNVAPGMPVVKLVKVGQVKVKVSVPESEIANVKIKMPVSVTVPAIYNKVYRGVIVEKGIAANALSRSYEVKALVDNPQSELMPGMICTLNMKQAGVDAAVVLPVSVIQTDEANRSFVWLNAGGKASRRFVETGQMRQSGVQIVSGLSADDEVIVEGAQKVSEGMVITTER